MKNLKLILILFVMSSSCSTLTKTERGYVNSKGMLNIGPLSKEGVYNFSEHGLPQSSSGSGVCSVCAN